MSSVTIALKAEEDRDRYGRKLIRKRQRQLDANFAARLEPFASVGDLRFWPLPAPMEDEAITRPV